MTLKPEMRWHARAGLVITLVIALGSAWINDRMRLAQAETRNQIEPDRRDRELDQMLARIAALEERCK